MAAREMKRARSRYAAQNRRLSENTEFEQLAACLPIARPISSQLLDKASIVRLSIVKLKLAHFSYAAPDSWRHNVITNTHSENNQRMFSESKIGNKILEALDGFLFCLSPDGTILYMSETVSVGLGLSQIEMMGNHISQYMHSTDSKHFQKVIGPLLGHDIMPNEERSLCLRIKSGLSKRASKDAVQTAVGYKVVYMQAQQRTGVDENLGVCGLGFVLPCSMSGEYRLDSSTFVLTTHLNLKVHYVDARGAQILGWESEPTHLRSLGLYSLVHADDMHLLAKFHTNMLELGGSTSDYLRLLCGGGGVAVVYAVGMRVHKHKSNQSLNFLSLCCTLIAFQSSDTILDSCQLQQ